MCTACHTDPTCQHNTETSILCCNSKQSFYMCKDFLCLQLRLISDSPERLGMLLASVAGQDVIVDVDEPSTSR